MEPKMRIDNLLNGGGGLEGANVVNEVDEPSIYNREPILHQYEDRYSRGMGGDSFPLQQNLQTSTNDSEYRNYDHERNRERSYGIMGASEGAYDYSINNSSSRPQSSRHHYNRERTSSSAQGFNRSSGRSSHSHNHGQSNRFSAYHTGNDHGTGQSVHRAAEYHAAAPPPPPPPHHPGYVVNHSSDDSAKIQSQRGSDHRDQYLQQQNHHPNSHYHQQQHQHQPSLLPPFNDFVSGPSTPAIYPPIIETHSTTSSSTPISPSMTSSSSASYYNPHNPRSYPPTSPYTYPYYPSQYADDAASTGEGANALLTFANYVTSTAAISEHSQSYSHRPSPTRRDSSRLIDPLLRSPHTPLFHTRPNTTPTPSPSTSPRSTSSTTPTLASPSSVSPSSHNICCSYTHVCTTESPLRKVVSHIFGRNKLSTRQIPTNVWVYYCRKHYQRSRYRNPRGFAKQQVVLVRKQCQRLEEWGGVRDWVIKVRRREEIRLSKEGEEMGGGDAGGSWIQDFVGRNKGIQEIYTLLDRIEVEVSGNGGKFPDVELLPNVDLDLVEERHEDDEGQGGKKRGRVGEQSGGGPGKRRAVERVIKMETGHGIKSEPIHGTRGSARLMMLGRRTPPN